MTQSTLETIVPAADSSDSYNFAATFEKMKSSDFQLIFERGERMSFVRNALILGQDQPNEAIYIVTQGAVRIERHSGDSVTELAKLGPWSVFGEMSYLDNHLVSADVVADDFVTLIRIDGADLDNFISQEPGFGHRFFQSLAITISRRLRSTSSYV